MEHLQGHYGKIKISGTSNFSENSAQWGGGVRVLSNATLYFSGASNFIYNSAMLGGGASAHGGILHISGTCNFINNSAQYEGGVYIFQGATVNLCRSCNFINNSAEHGGGIFVSSAVYISGTNNYAAYDNRFLLTGSINLISNVYPTTVYINGNISFRGNSALCFTSPMASYRFPPSSLPLLSLTCHSPPTDKVLPGPHQGHHLSSQVCSQLQCKRWWNAFGYKKYG